MKHSLVFALLVFCLLVKGQVRPNQALKIGKQVFGVIDPKDNTAYGQNYQLRNYVVDTAKGWDYTNVKSFQMFTIDTGYIFDKTPLQISGPDTLVWSAGDTTYNPRTNYTNTATYRRVGYAVVKPKGYSPFKQYPMWVVIHGVGERANGRLSDLVNVLQGYDYDGAGPNPRMPVVAYPELFEGQRAYNFVTVVVNYMGEFQPDDINFVLDEVQRDYSISKGQVGLIGFSLGGGAVGRYITSNQANADRIAVAVMAAPVNWCTNYSYIKNSKLPVILVTNKTDGTVSPTNATNIFNSIKATAPEIKPTLIVLPGSGHGGLREVEAVSFTPQAIYPYLKVITNETPTQYPATDVLEPIELPDPIISDVVLKYTAPTITNVPTFQLKACDSSKNYDSDKFKWGVYAVPKGASVWGTYVTSGAGWCNATVTLTVEGAYSFWVQACKGETCARDSFVVTYQKQTVPVPRTVKEFDGTYLIFNDGTQELGTIRVLYADKKFIVKTASGEYIQTW